MTPQIPAHFQLNHQHLLNCLKLGGLQPKTIELYSHGVRRAAAYFNDQIDDLTQYCSVSFFVSHCAYLLSGASHGTNQNGIGSGCTFK